MNMACKRLSQRYRIELHLNSKKCSLCPVAVPCPTAFSLGSSQCDLAKACSPSGQATLIPLKTMRTGLRTVHGCETNRSHEMEERKTATPIRTLLTWHLANMRGTAVSTAGGFTGMNSEKEELNFCSQVLRSGVWTVAGI